MTNGYPADLLVTVDGGPDDVLSLQRWLSGQDDLAGRTRLVRPGPGPGRMGAVLDTIAVAAGSGGTVTALIGALSVWMRNRGAKVAATVKKGNRSITISADRVRAADLTELREMVAELSRTLDQD